MTVTTRQYCFGLPRRESSAPGANLPPLAATSIPYLGGHFPPLLVLVHAVSNGRRRRDPAPTTLQKGPRPTPRKPVSHPLAALLIWASKTGVPLANNKRLFSAHLKSTDGLFPMFFSAEGGGASSTPDSWRVGVLFVFVQAGLAIPPAWVSNCSNRHNTVLRDRPSPSGHHRPACPAPPHPSQPWLLAPFDGHIMARSQRERRPSLAHPLGPTLPNFRREPNGVGRSATSRFFRGSGCWWQAPRTPNREMEARQISNCRCAALPTVPLESWTQKSTVRAPI